MSSLPIRTVNLSRDGCLWLNKRWELPIDMINNHGQAYRRGFTTQTSEPGLVSMLAPPPRAPRKLQKCRLWLRKQPWNHNLPCVRSLCVCVCVWWSDTADALSPIGAGHYQRRISLKCWFSPTDVFSSLWKSFLQSILQSLDKLLCHFTQLFIHQSLFHTSA